MDTEINFERNWDTRKSVYNILTSRLIVIKNKHIVSFSEAEQELWDTLLTEVRRYSPELSVRIAVGQYEYNRLN